MNDSSQPTPSSDIARIIKSAERLGVEIDESEAVQWLTAMAAMQSDEQIVVDTRTGVFGHAVTMLDFSPDDLAYFRKIGELVGFPDEPGVETALALSGSAAQSRIQTYPGDCDFFERINIKAGTREEACRTLARILREKALSAEKGPTYQLMEVRLGSYPEAVVKDGRPFKAGASISWSPDEVRAGRIECFTPDGRRVEISWEDAALDSGWCKLDWVIADPVRGRLANASNMLDVTWEAPDGGITPLDGYLDPYFQEVYLEAESIPIFSKLSRHVSADALDEYVTQLEKEVHKYVSKQINYGKAAKRMYNVFRLTGRYEEAAYVRELFDEPTTLLYQVWALIRTIDEALQPDCDITMEAAYKQADQLIVAVVDVLEGAEETEIVRLLLRLRNAMAHQQSDQEAWQADVQAARGAVINIVNNFFYEKLTAVPTIKAYMEQFQHQAE
ncbi:MAG: hypothetical protein ACE5E7_00965 [Anaerolineae bacterium]